MVGFVGKTQSIVVGFVVKKQSIVVGFVVKKQSIVVEFVVKKQSIVVGFVVKAQRIVVECLRLDSALLIIIADFAQSLQAPSLRQQLVHVKLFWIDRFHSRDQIPDNCCYAAMFVYRHCKQIDSFFKRRWFCV